MHRSRHKNTNRKARSQSSSLGRSYSTRNESRSGRSRSPRSTSSRPARFCLIRSPGRGVAKSARASSRPNASISDHSGSSVRLRRAKPTRTCWPSTRWRHQGPATCRALSTGWLAPTAQATSVATHLWEAAARVSLCDRTLNTSAIHRVYKANGRCSPLPTLRPCLLIPADDSRAQAPPNGTVRPPW
jgi:hypothetical protein